MKLRCIFLFCIFGISTSIVAAQTAKPKGESKGNLESSQPKNGLVTIKGYTDIGSVYNQVAGLVIVQSREIIDVNSGVRSYDIAITVREDRDIRERSTSIVEYEDIDSLLTGIDRVSKIDLSSTKLANFEAAYQAKNDLAITIYNEKDVIKSAVSSGSVIVLFKLEDLNHLRQLIADAKAKLEAIKPK